MTIKRKRLPLGRIISRFPETPLESAEADLAVLVGAMLEIIAEGENRTTNKFLLTRIAREALKEIGY